MRSMKLSAASAAKMPLDGLKAIYGMNDDTVLYWAHHEKLCLVDSRIAFMGGLDLCYGRWDTNQHSIADAHPGDLDNIVFPGQDYNNARIMDFQDVTHWENNKLDRTKNSRMGWSDISLCLSGPVVEDLRGHFVDRWNFIYNEKYNVRKDVRYSRLTFHPTSVGVFGELPPSSGDSYGQNYAGYQSQGYDGANQSQSRSQYQGQGQGQDYSWQASRGLDTGEGAERGLFSGHGPGQEGTFGDRFLGRVEDGYERFHDRYGDRIPGHHHGEQPNYGPGAVDPETGVACQITRSCAKWSHGVSIQHSIANAYIEIIKNSQHFVYIENQFFITATCDEQKPIKNKIGGAIAERIIRAARNNEQYKMIIMIPAVPAFAGDLRGDEALSTRAIMEFQYFSISRGGHSIMETIARAGVNPMDYIRFYNLRNYDRINNSAAMAEAEKLAGVSYEDARKQHDDTYGGGFATDPSGQPYGQPAGQQYAPGQPLAQNYAGYGERPQYSNNDPYYQYQQGAAQIGNKQGLGSGRWDSVAECYMLGGEDIRNVPWEHGNVDEIDAF
ncbi:hypothetical protein LTS18_010899, partial [Coniosporium uncinatum]